MDYPKFFKINLFYPSISARSWLIVWLAYGCNCELDRLAPTESISSINITHGDRALAAAKIIFS